MASADEPLSASLDAQTDPLMGTNDHIKPESRPGDRPALYTALVTSSRLSHIQSLTPSQASALVADPISHWSATF